MGGEWRTKIDTLDNDACVMAIRHLDCDRTIIPHQHQSLPGMSEQEAGTRIKSSLAQRKKV